MNGYIYPVTEGGLQVYRSDGYPWYKTRCPHCLEIVLVDVEPGAHVMTCGCGGKFAVREADDLIENSPEYRAARLAEYVAEELAEYKAEQALQPRISRLGDLQR